jgi:hypothetical protein
MRTLICGLALAGLSALAALAGDLTIVMTAKGKGPMGFSNSGKEVHLYSAKAYRINRESTQMDTLVDFSEMVTYTINHKKKLIQRVSFDDAIAMMEEVQKQAPEGMEGMMNMMFGDPSNFKVEELGTETVAGRKCQRHRIIIGKLSFETSNDPSLKPPIPEASLARMIKAQGALAAAAGPSAKYFAKLYAEMSKIKGIALKTHMSGFIGVDSATEAESVKEGAIPDSAFALPAGYRTEDLGKKMREQMAKHPH